MLGRCYATILYLFRQSPGGVTVPSVAVCTAESHSHVLFKYYTVAEGIVSHTVCEWIRGRKKVASRPLSLSAGLYLPLIASNFDGGINVHPFLFAL